MTMPAPPTFTPSGAACRRGAGLPLSLVIRATGAAMPRIATADFAGVSIDTRSIAPGALYVAIRGERLDGHDFVAEAEQAGAGGVLVARGRSAQVVQATSNVPVLEVDDPILAIGRLARAYRMTMPAKVVALTGSVGKTSTKEMLASIFAAAVGEEAVHRTRGNLNNHIGVPLTLLAIEPHHRFAVVELGMSSLGEIAYLEMLARPDLAMVTTVAGVHVEQLGDLAAVGRAKGEIFEGRAAAGRAIAVAPFGAERLTDAFYQVPLAMRRTFGTGGDAILRSAKLDAHGTHISIELGPSKVEALLPILGAHQGHNAAGAACAAHALGVDVSAIVAGLSSVRVEKHRMQLLTLQGRTVIDDCYNASPPSVMAALDALVDLAPQKKRVAILGDMLELGVTSDEAHAQIGRYAASRVSALIALGPRSHKMVDAAHETLPAVFHTEDPTEAARRALSLTSPGDALLVKASRGMKLERVLEALGVP